MKFVDVKNDVAFHKIFGNAHKTVTLISFLNAVMRLEGENQVVSVTIENPYMFPASHGGKTVVIDIRATDHLGRHFIVEMHISTSSMQQVADKEGFEKRTQFYASRDYAAQIDRGEEYVKLRPTYFIGILNFAITINASYYSHHQTIDVETGQWLFKDIQYFFIELPKFKKTLGQLQTMMDKWTFFIKNAESLTIIPEDVIDEGLKTAYIEADKHNWNEAELNAYYDSGAREADQIQERKKSKQEGKMEKEIEAILGMNKIGISIEKIAEALSISSEYVKSVISNEKK